MVVESLVCGMDVTSGLSHRGLRQGWCVCASKPVRHTDFLSAHISISVNELLSVFVEAV